MTRWLALGCALAAGGCNAGDKLSELVNDLGNIDVTDVNKDSDNDGIPDVVEGMGDADGDGIPAYLDFDERGNDPVVNVPPVVDGGPITSFDATPGQTEDATPPGPDGCSVVSAESQFERSPVDVIWAIDNSGSMFDDFLNVANGISGFNASVTNSGANMRVVMVSSFVVGLGADVANDTEHFLLRPTNVQSTDAFRVLLNDYDGYSSFLRPDAATHIIVVTDDSSDMAHTEFRTQMEGRLGHGFTFHAITAGIGGVGGVFGFASAYSDLASETGGIDMQISGDWSMIFDQLQSAVVRTAEIPCEVPVSNENNADLDNVSVIYRATDGQMTEFFKSENLDGCMGQDAWYYDDVDAPSRILLCPTACEKVKGEGNLDVVIACEPPPVVPII